MARLLDSTYVTVLLGFILTAALAGLLRVIG